ALDLGDGVVRLPADDSSDAKSELPVTVNGLDHPLAKLAAANQENRFQIVAAPAQLVEGLTEGQASSRDENERVGDEEEEREPRIAFSDEVGERYDDQRCGNHRLENFEDFLDMGPRAIGRV